jgi:tetratricopeptide (TPR) repeat protein
MSLFVLFLLLVVLGRCESHNQKSLAAQYEQGLKYYSSGNILAAKNSFEKLRDMTDGSVAEVHIALGATFERGKQFTEAMGALAFGMEKHPKEPKIPTDMCALGLKAFQHDRRLLSNHFLGMVTSACLKAQQLSPKDATVYESVGALESLFTDWKKSATAYGRALQLYLDQGQAPHSEKVLLALTNTADMYARMGAYDKSIALGERVLEWNPRRHPPLTQLLYSRVLRQV